MKTVTLITDLVWKSDCQDGIHNLAEGFHNHGWRVLFLTVGISLISSLQRDVRLRCYTVKMRNVLLEEENGLYSYLHFTPWHSMGLPIHVANCLIAPVIKLYPRFSFVGLEFLLKDTDLFVFERGDGLFLFEHIQKLNPHARMVYRVSDSHSLQRKHPEIQKLESQVLESFDYVSVANSNIKKRFQGLTNLHLDLHDINKDACEKNTGNQFPSGILNSEHHPTGQDENGQKLSWEEIVRKLAGEVWACKPAKKPRGAFRKGPELSVVIPTYNSLHLLPKTLASLESQQTDCKRFEVIVVDDGSTDGTSDWLKQFSTETMLQFHWLTIPNGGPGIARNLGAQEARADWIGLLDADVTATPEWVSRALELIEEHPDAGAFEGRVEVSHPELASMFTHQTENLSGGRYVTCNLVLPREVVRFHPGYKGAFREDSDLAFSIQQEGKRIYFDPALKVFHPPLPANIWNPLKLARRYFFDALLHRRFPEQYKSLDAFNFLGINVPHLRKKLMLAFGAGQLLILAVWLSQAPAGMKGASVLFYVLSAMAASLPYMRFVSRNLRPRKNLFLFAGVLHMIPWVLGFSLFHGKWSFRNESRFDPNRAIHSKSLPKPMGVRAG